MIDKDEPRQREEIHPLFAEDGDKKQAPTGSTKERPSKDTHREIGDANAETYIRNTSGINAPVAAPGIPKTLHLEQESTISSHHTGQELAALFKDRGVHPIIVVGGRGSGKTTMLASLLKYAQFAVEASGSIVLMEDLYPSGNTLWEEQLSWARQLVDRTATNLENSFVPPATKAFPFFVPIEFIRTNGESAKFAFLESSGEFYMLKDGGDSPHKRFPAVLESFLSSFSGPLSAMYVLPMVSGETSQNGALESPKSVEMTERDHAMFGVIDQYIKCRRATFHNDRHLLLLTKWDAQFSSMSHQDLIPSSERIKEDFANRYPKAWARFSSLPIPEGLGRKRYSIYSAGMMYGSRVLATAAEDRPRFDYFPRKVWDWVWEGATGRILYEDVRPPKPDIITRLANWLRGKGNA
jgi:ABC-type oligopeptide transport system ATPase subunit